MVTVEALIRDFPYSSIRLKSHAEKLIWGLHKVFQYLYAFPLKSSIYLRLKDHFYFYI
ncbi:hypothetical protein L293_0187 [Acinetobacter gyllenbergii CIP 110306 = MTCC 11365]|nr:hypothetical protein L293_0187 [Acinetobacter gyllenbergii CIP 110306 = MTCC 11365]